MKHKWQEGDLFVCKRFPPITILGMVKRVAPTLTGHALQADVVRYINGRMTGTYVDEFYDVGECEPLTTAAQDVESLSARLKRAHPEAAEFPSPRGTGEPEAAFAAANAQRIKERE